MQKSDIKEKVKKLIQKQRETLEKEIELYRKKRRDTESYWGCGGAYRRQQEAIEKREKQLEELDDFEMQLKHTVRHQEVKMYIFGCRECGSITMVNQQPFDEWHECPVCRRMVHLHKLESEMFQIVDTGESWMTQIKKTARKSEEGYKEEE